jgi:hypothetical protein
MKEAYGLNEDREVADLLGIRGASVVDVEVIVCQIGQVGGPGYDDARPGGSHLYRQSCRAYDGARGRAVRQSPNLPEVTP